MLSGLYMPTWQATIRQRVYETMRRKITSGHWRVGERLPSMKSLARNFHASVFPVHQALELLQEEGYVVKRHGSGTYVAETRPTVTLADTVALCLQAHAHVFGDLSMLLARHLHERRISPVVVDTDQPSGMELMCELARSGVRVFVVNGHEHFPFGVLQQPVFGRAVVLGIINWDGPRLPGLLRVLTDYEDGGRMVARSLFERGHRHVLIITTSTRHFVRSCASDGLTSANPRRLMHGHSFLLEWSALGGRWSMIKSRVVDAQVVELDQDEFAGRFTGRADAPTAVFGFRDIEALLAQKAIRERLPELDGRVEVFGYFDTPWSRAGHPPISTVSLCLEKLAAEASAMIEQTLRGDIVEPDTRIIRPRLLIRESSQIINSVKAGGAA
jgi:DNA-binding LacI/PurR family transcriptional regulator